MFKLFFLMMIPSIFYAQQRLEGAVPAINVKAIQYRYLSKNKVTTIRPVDRIKITLTCRTNFKNISAKLKSDELILGDLQSALSDIDFNDYISIVRYDLRLKYYLNFRSRFVARMQFLGPNRNIYTAGLQFKLKQKKHKQIVEV